MNFFAYLSSNYFLLALLLTAMFFSVLFLSLYINERKKASRLQALSEREFQFCRLLKDNISSCFMFIRETDLRVLYISSNFSKMTGFDEESVYADVELLKEALDKQTARSIVKALSNWDKKDFFRCEFDYGILNSQEVKRGSILVFLSQEAGCYFVALNDMTHEYKEREKLLNQLNKAQKESQAKTAFLSSMSHEIRTPMNGIIGMISLAQSCLNNEAAAGEYLKKAGSLSQFLLTLINDILDMSRIESGKMELENVAFDLFGVSDKLNSMFKNTIENKGVHWVIEMQDFDIRYVVGDELRLTQVIINFISNANKFTPAGGTVSVIFRQMTKIDNKVHLMIKVKDTGKGIKAEFLKNIFKPFEQESASTAHHYGGSGLGMAIADNIVKMMNGQITVESEPGKGSEFTVYVSLPIADCPQDKPSRTEPNGSYGSKEELNEHIKNFSLNGMHILLAEDIDINAEIVMEILGMDGVIIDRAHDGAEAVKMFTESDPGTYDVILMDIQMPNMDGYQATAEIRKSEKEDSDIPIFAMSANAFVEDKRKSISVGMNGHLSKPVDFDEVRRVIAEYIFLHREG